MLIKHKARHSILFKAIAIAVVALFLVNDFAFALSPELRTLQENFKDEYGAVFNLLTARFSDNYIKSKGGIEGLVAERSGDVDDTETIDIGGAIQKILIVAIPDLLKRTGQSACCASDKLPWPIIYIDKKLFNNSAVREREKKNIMKACRDMARFRKDKESVTFNYLFSPNNHLYNSVQKVCLKKILERYEISADLSCAKVLRSPDVKPMAKWELHEILFDEFISSFYEEGAINYGNSRHYGEGPGEYEEIADIIKFFTQTLGYEPPVSILRYLMDNEQINILSGGAEEAIFEAHPSFYNKFNLNICSSCGESYNNMGGGDVGGVIVHELMALAGFMDDKFNQQAEEAYKKWRNGVKDGNAIQDIKMRIQDEEETLKKESGLPDFIDLQISDNLKYHSDEKPKGYSNAEEMDKELLPLVSAITKAARTERYSVNPADIEEIIVTESNPHRRIERLKKIKRETREEGHEIAAPAYLEIKHRMPAISATCNSHDVLLKEKAEAYLTFIVEHGIIPADGVLLELHRQEINISKGLEEAFRRAFFDLMPEDGAAGNSRLRGQKLYQMERDAQKILGYAQILSQRAIYFDERNLTEEANKSYKQVFELLRVYFQKLAAFEKESHELEVRIGVAKEPDKIPPRSVFYDFDRAFYVHEALLRISKEENRLNAIGVTSDALTGTCIDISCLKEALGRADDEVEKFRLSLLNDSEKIFYLHGIKQGAVKTAFKYTQEFNVRAAQQGKVDELNRLYEESAKLAQMLNAAQGELQYQLFILSIRDRDWAKMSEKDAAREKLKINSGTGPDILSLIAIRNNDELMVNALDKQIGITLKGESGALKKLGIFISVEGKPDYYRFADMMIGQDVEYTKTLINAIISELKASPLKAVREVVKMAIINEIDKQSVVPENKVLWHVIENDVIPEGQKAGIVTQVNKEFRDPKRTEKIWILGRGESVADAVRGIRAVNRDALIDIALSKEDHIKDVPDDKSLKMLVFESHEDFIQLEGVIAALRALHSEDGLSMLLRLYSVMAGKPYKDPPKVMSNDPKEFAHKLVFYLPKITSVPTDEMRKLNERLLELLTAA